MSEELKNGHGAALNAAMAIYGGHTGGILLRFWRFLER